MKATFCLVSSTSQCYRSPLPEVNTTYAQRCWNQSDNKCLQGHWPLHSLMFNELYEWPWFQKPLEWEKSCTSWIKKAPTEKIVCVCVRVRAQAVTRTIYIYLYYRDIRTYTPSVTAPQSTHSQRNSHVASIWDDLSMFSLRPPLLKWKNTSRILKHASQSKGRKVTAKVFTMKSRS